MSDERSLRDALERAQARAMTLERLVAEEAEDREALADELLKVRRALEAAEQKLLPAPGERRELVRLRARLHAQQLQVRHLLAERDQLRERIAELEAAKKK